MNLKYCSERSRPMGKSREKSGKTLQKLETIRQPTKNEGVWQKNGNYLLCFLDLKVFFLCRVID